jgi:hypothetical protein
MNNPSINHRGSPKPFSSTLKQVNTPSLPARPVQAGIPAQAVEKTSELDQKRLVAKLIQYLEAE